MNRKVNIGKKDDNVGEEMGDVRRSKEEVSFQNFVKIIVIFRKL